MKQFHVLPELRDGIELMMDNVDNMFVQERDGSYYNKEKIFNLLIRAKENVKANEERAKQLKSPIKDHYKQEQYVTDRNHKPMKMEQLVHHFQKLRLYPNLMVEHYGKYRGSNIVQYNSDKAVSSLSNLLTVIWNEETKRRYDDSYIHYQIEYQNIPYDSVRDLFAVKLTTCLCLLDISPSGSPFPRSIDHCANHFRLEFNEFVHWKNIVRKQINKMLFHKNTRLFRIIFEHFSTTIMHESPEIMREGSKKWKNDGLIDEQIKYGEDQ